MILHTAWFFRKGETSPELLVAWDEYTFDENPEGYRAELAKEWESVKSDDSGAGMREIDIHVPMRQIMETFEVPVVDGTVKP